MKKLFVSVLGNRNSGKTKTWNSLFSPDVRTGKSSRSLLLLNEEYIDAFLINGSPQETNKNIEELLSNEPNIVLCSTQYKKEAFEMYEAVIKKGYDLYVQWLNPGYNDVDSQYFDCLGLCNYLLANNATISIRNGKTTEIERVNELKAYIFGWATNNKLIKTKTP